MKGGTLQLLESALRSTGLLKFGEVSPNARAFLAASLCRLGGDPLLWLLPTEAAAEEAYQGIRFFLGENERSVTDPFAARVVSFPLHQAVPYDELSPDRLVVADRLAVLFRLVHASAPGLLVASVSAVMRKTIPRSAIDSASILVLQGQELDRTRLAADLVRAGYLNVPLVEDPGTFAVRGGILDLYTSHLPLPVRIELLGDEVESIRTFDPASQRTIARLDSVYLGPVREILLDDEGKSRALAALDRLADQLDLPAHRILPLKRSLRDGLWFFGIESLLPAFYPSLESLLDFLPPSARILISDPGAVQHMADESWSASTQAYAETLSANSLAFPPESMLVNPRELQERIGERARLVLGLCEEAGTSVTFPTRDVSGLRERIEKANQSGPLQPLLELLEEWRRSRIRPFIVASRPARAREVGSLLSHRDLPVRVENQPFDLGWTEQETQVIRIVPGDLPGGFYSESARIGFIPDTELFGKPVRKTRPPPLRSRIGVLKPNDIVVHADLGIGRFERLCKLGVEGVEADYLQIVYRDGDRLYLPVTRMSLIERYQGPEGSAPALSRLGGTAWERIKQRIHQALLEMASRLIHTHAKRKSHQGERLPPPGEEFSALEASFPFEETEDQQRAIREVVADLTGQQVMDRLVCGDVGFGKTEVAIRAAYLNALNNRQTAILVPTTVLALQHLNTFRNRLLDRAVRVEMVSRLVSPEDQKRILAGCAAGQVDILIGTHRLLMKDVSFQNLGLLIIDEEHRFGVRHKEKLKELKAVVDVLTMTATPIPRTLQLALTGLRDISVIQTPPPGRRSIRTIITRFSRRVIEEAVSLELSRGGQVFFLHNWVSSLPAMERFVRKIVPQARCAIAHGQMGERQLEKVMTSFVRREIDVLLCTSIIESGLDIPSANTILVNRADHFGLAQLHQIRGRVGRASERAYAYFLIPGLSTITNDARKRLEALSEFAELGSGYRLASQDLEIRGSGNLLGKSQSGHIAAVGFEMYSRLLERAVMEIRGQAALSGPESEILLPIAGYLPEGYVPELEHRLDLYDRLSRAPGEVEVYEIEREIVDRFGPEPPEVENLCELMALKTQLRRAGVLKLEMRSGTIRIQFDPQGCRDPARLVQLAQEQPDRVSLDPAGGFQIKLGAEEQKSLLPTVRALAERLSVR